MFALDVSKTAPGFERVVPPDAVLEQVARGLIFTEGPVWLPRQEALVFTDIRGDRILRWTAGGELETIYSPSGKANGLTLDHQGRLLVAGWGSRTVWRLEPDGSATVLASRHDGKKLNTPNDIVVKSDGTIWWTDMAGGLFIPGMCTDDVQRYLDFEGLFRIDPDGSVTLLVEDFQGPNGLCFSPDESLLYVNETGRRQVRVWEVQPDNSLRNGRVFYRDEGTEPGTVDGMKADIEGNIYVTGSAGIHVVDPSGRLLGRIHVPDHTSNMAWGDSDWRTLYITARGQAYRLRLLIPGLPHGEENRRAALAV